MSHRGLKNSACPGPASTARGWAGARARATLFFEKMWNRCVSEFIREYSEAPCAAYYNTGRVLATHAFAGGNAICQRTLTVDWPPRTPAVFFQDIVFMSRYNDEIGRERSDYCANAVSPQQPLLRLRLRLRARRYIAYVPGSGPKLPGKLVYGLNPFFPPSF